MTELWKLISFKSTNKRLSFANISIFFGFAFYATCDMVEAMTYEDFKRNLRSTGLSIVEFAVLMGMPHRQAITNYSKTGSVPDHMAVIVRLMAALVGKGGDPRAALWGIEMKRKQRRGSGFERKADTDVGDLSKS